MPEGDTIHRAANRLRTALAGRVIELADAPSPRSPIHGRAKSLQGRTLELVEARGKHLLAHFSGELVIHSHLGMNGRWRITADGRMPFGRPWLVLAQGRAIAAQADGKLLRLVSESRIRNDPGLAQLGPDPLAAGFDLEAAAARLRIRGAGRELGDALLDQRIISGIGNAIRNEACFRAGISPWRQVDALSASELESVVAENERVMRISIAKGRRPRSIYRAGRSGCPRCRGEVRSRGQGDANRTAYWCPSCQT
ncbi:MAG: Fpg/Nei family DNA glycosylase [Solirubrobacterales bacterium]|nr:Fpg/Nei family DNA glycosylase [Solirubrobacterales bacterium]